MDISIRTNRPADNYSSLTLCSFTYRYLLTDHCPHAWTCHEGLTISLRPKSGHDLAFLDEAAAEEPVRQCHRQDYSRRD